MNEIKDSLMDELFAPQDVTADEKYTAIVDQFDSWCRQKHSSAASGSTFEIINSAYQITIANLCMDNLTHHICPGFSETNYELLNYFYKMSLKNSIPEYFIDAYYDTDLGMADATDQLVDNLIKEITLFLDDTDEDVW